MSIKLKHSGGNSVSLNPPTSAPTSSEVAFKLPNADGSVNQLLKTDGSGNLGWATDQGGKILQIVQASHSTQIITTSSSYIDTGLTANITTSANHGGVLVITNLAMGATANNGGDAYLKFNIVRGSTQLREGMCGAWEDNLSGHTHNKYWQPAMNFYDTGTSASTTYTYKCQFKKLSDAVNAFSNNTVQAGSYLILMEVAA